MRIMAVARQLGVSADWLRRLERTGRLPAPRRDVNGHRRYTDEDLTQLKEAIFAKRSEQAEEAHPVSVN